MDQSILKELQSTIVHIHPIVESAVSRAHEAGYDPANALQGLVISDEEVARYLQETPLASPWMSDVIADLPPLEPRSALLQTLVALFQLTDIDLYILLLCLAPELDLRYERVFSYLQDDVNQKRPTVNLMMNLLGTHFASRFAVYDRLLPHQPLRRFRLVQTQPVQGQSGFLAQVLSLDQRMVQYFLGYAQIDARIEDVVCLVDLPQDRLAGLCVADEQTHLMRATLPSAPMILMRGLAGSGQVETAAALCAEHDWTLLQVERVSAELLQKRGDVILREARLQRAGLIFVDWAACLDEAAQPPQPFWQHLVEWESPIFLCVDQEWEPPNALRGRRLLRVAFTIPDYATQRDLWLHYAQCQHATLDVAHAEELARKYNFTPRQIEKSVSAATDQAASSDHKLGLSHLYAGAQAHADLRLGHLARRVVPRHTWSDLILPEDRLQQLREMQIRAQQAHIVQDNMGFGDKIAPHRGVSALFAGKSGTGKTMAAEVIARELGLVMYKIDLSGVVSKYIGETEKNLSTIFDEAQSSNAILFFDEADALFGKRSEVKDARDRYANIEVAYLLQRIEQYDGIAILATNLRQNIDDAFTRRLHFLVDFPFPDTPHRQRIWQTHFPEKAPLDADVDFAELAARYPLAGGHIRNAAVAAAYLSVEDGGTIRMAHIRAAIRREHQKMGRLMTD